MAPPPSGKGKETNSLNPPTSFFLAAAGELQLHKCKKRNTPPIAGLQKGPPLSREKSPPRRQEVEVTIC